jgi:hypothetical protein
VTKTAIRVGKMIASPAVMVIVTLAAIGLRRPLVVAMLEVVVAVIVVIVGVG